MSSLAQYARQYKRGSRSLKASQHFRDLRSRYQPRQLHANFYGPKEWFQIAMAKMRKKSFKEVKSIAKQTTVEVVEPKGYPFLSKSMLVDGKLDWSHSSPDIEQERKTWEQYRHDCAGVYPSSAFAVEERVLDAWNQYCGDEGIEWEHPRSMTVGGLKVKLSPIIGTISDVQNEGLQEITQQLLQQNKANPAKPPSVEPNFLKTAIEALPSEDTSVALPILVERWRMLCTGSLYPGYETPDRELSDAILRKVVEAGSPETAVHMLRHKMAYKLNPTMAGIEDVMEGLLKANEDYVAPEAEVVEEPKAEPPKKRRVARKDYPFKQGPRFYFYKPLPFIVQPEPSRFAEFELPKLPNTNDTKRLLPDDKSKKLELLINEAETQNRDKITPSPAEQMFQLFYYATSKSPRYYSLQPSQKLFELLNEAKDFVAE